MSQQLHRDYRDLLPIHRRQPLAPRPPVRPGTIVMGAEGTFRIADGGDHVLIKKRDFANRGGQQPE